jgi:hypothetical protein
MFDHVEKPIQIGRSLADFDRAVGANLGTAVGAARA